MQFLNKRKQLLEHRATELHGSNRDFNHGAFARGHRFSLLLTQLAKPLWGRTKRSRPHQSTKRFIQDGIFPLQRTCAQSRRITCLFASRGLPVGSPELRYPPLGSSQRRDPNAYFLGKYPAIPIRDGPGRTAVQQSLAVGVE